MKLTNEQMLNSVTVLSKAEEKGMLGYAIARNRQKLLTEVQEYTKKRDELLMKYGEDVGGGQFQLTSENAAKFYEELRPYSELVTDVNVMQISQEVFCSGNLTSSMMYTLDWMVAE